MLAVRGAKTEGDDKLGSCALVRVKSNIGPSDGGFAYHIEPREFEIFGERFSTSTLVFNPIPLEGSSAEILRNVECNGGDYVENTDALASACNFLKDS